MAELVPLTRDELAVRLYVAIRVMPKSARRLIASKLPHEGDEGTRMLVDHILSHLGGYEFRAPPPIANHTIGG